MADLLFRSVIYDLDGVITKTALVHAAAWKAVFDEYLQSRQERFGEPFKEFTHENDYLPYVDGKPRYEGVDSFLKSRGVNIEFGDPEDAPALETVCGVGNRKNIKFLEILERDGVEKYDSTVKLIKDLIDNGIRIGVASSSKNCQYVLKSAGIEDLFEARVDGVVSAETGLKGKPESDIFVTAAGNVGTKPFESVVVEDATSGVQAGRNGAFGLVLGLARENNEEELLKNGADVVVPDIAPIDISWINKWFQRKPVMMGPDLSSSDVPIAGIDNKNGSIMVNPCYAVTIKDRITSGKDPVFFLDFDGTLTPIVDKPEQAELSDDMRALIKRLSERFKVSIVSGRPRGYIENLVGLDTIYYAGSHGMDIKGPDLSMVCSNVESLVPLIREVQVKLEDSLGSIPGIGFEKKDFSLTVHYRLVSDDNIEKIRKTLTETVSGKESLEILNGKKVLEISPKVDWHKGKAVRWIMEAMGLEWDGSSVVYIGDDRTDEDAFRMIRTRGTSILVSEEPCISNADFCIGTPNDVKLLLENILAIA